MRFRATTACLRPLSSEFRVFSRAWSFWCLISFLWPTNAAAAQYHFDSWTADTGLPQNTVSAILQARDGYLWLTTSEGLVRFDGARFTTFDRENTAEIAGNYLTSLCESADGALWIGGENNEVIRFKGGTFSGYTIGARAGDWVHAIANDADGDVWVSLNDQLIRWAHNRFSPVQARGFEDDQGPPLRVVERADRGGFWRIVRGGLALFDSGRVAVLTRHDGLPRAAIQVVAKDEYGAVWVGTEGPLVRIRDGKTTQIRRPPECLANSDLSFVSSAALKVACFSGPNTLSLIALNSWERRDISPIPAEFPRNIKSQIFYEDREGDLWIGTQSQGLYRARRDAVVVYSQQEGLRDRNVYTVLQDADGAIWLGCWPGTLSKFEHGKFTNYSKKDGLTGEQITSLYQDHSGRLWVGAYGDGMRILQAGRFVAANGPRLQVVKAILQDREGTFWFGTERQLLRYSKNVTTYTTREGLAGSNIQVLIEDSGGGIWIGGYGGLTHYRNDRFTAYTVRDGLPDSPIRALYQDAEGVLWIGTYDGGLLRFKDGKFVRYTTREGLFNNGVFEILEDKHARLWMSSNRGIYRVSKYELNEYAAGRTTFVTSVAYGKADGMRDAECNGGHWPAAAKTRDGKLWFATQDGVAVIDPENLPESALPPPMVIEACSIEHAPVATGGGVRVKPGQDHLEIRYTALSLINSERIRFRYLLEGLDSRWVDAADRRTADYFHLPPGHYVFRVVAANSGGVWNTTGASLNIVVVGPFYRTPWFVALALLAALGLVIFIWQVRVAEWKRERALQVAFSRELIASQERERKRVSAELHDSLGQSLAIIRTRALLSLGEPDNQRHASEQLNEIAQAASDAIDELKQIAFNLRPCHLERLGIRKCVAKMLAEISAVGGISVTCELDSIDELLPPEALINIYRIIQEGANNIVKHAQASRARFAIKRTGGELEILIEDNGKGFAAEEVSGLEPPQRGFGLIGIAERARMMGGDLAILSKPGQGTTLKIRIAVTREVKNVGEDQHPHRGRSSSRARRLAASHRTRI